MASRRCCLWAALGAVGLLSGCVERRFVVDTVPPGAKVYVNGDPVGFAPVDVPFTYYGTYNITLEADGFQTTTIRQRLAAPWFAYPPADFIVENLYPFKVSDIRRFSYDLPPVPQPSVEELKQKGESLRERGRNLPEPRNPPPPRGNPAPAAQTGPATPPAPAVTAPPPLVPAPAAPAPAGAVSPSP